MTRSSPFQNKKQTFKNGDEKVRMILVDFSSSLFHHGENCEHTRHVEMLLKKKFSLQQLGKKKWLLNRELQYQRLIPVEFMNDPEFVLNHIKKYGAGFEFASTQLKKDREFVLKAAQYKGFNFRFADENIRNDKEVVLAAVQHDDAALQSVSTALLNDKEFVLEVVGKNGMALRWCNEFQYDREVALAAVKQNGVALKYVTYDSSSHWYKTIALEAVKQHKEAVLWIPIGLLLDPDFFIQVLQILFPKDFQSLNHAEYSTNEIMTRMIQEFGFLLGYVSSKLRTDRKIVLSAVRNDGCSLRLASEDLQNDKEIALFAVQQRGDALQYVSEKLKGDKQIVLAAVKQNGFALTHASEELQNDREVVLHAVTQTGFSLRYASNEMKKDRQVVLTAVKQHGGALLQADDEMKRDQEMLLETVKQGLFNFQDASKDLLCDKQFLLKIAKLIGDTLRSYIPIEIINDHAFMVKLTEEIKNSGFVAEYSDELYQERMEHFYHGAYLGSNLDKRNH